ncbi:MAG: hypothetical protein R3348_09520, partial [Xanthomonadales bacterium]|nr:hypothetical protein [Xanthomonadales bacterium]
GLTASFQFDTTMPRGVEVTAWIASTVAAQDGAELGEDYNWNFTFTGEMTLAAETIQAQSVDDYAFWFPLSGDRVLVGDVSSVDPTVVKVHILGKSGSSETFELTSIPAGSTPFWIADDLAEAPNGDIALSMRLRNSSTVYADALIASGGGRNDDAYLFYYDASDGSWTKTVIMEDANKYSVSTSVEFSTAAELLLKHDFAETDYTNRLSYAIRRDTGGSFSSDFMSVFPFSHYALVSDPDIARAFTVDTIEEADTDGVVRDRAYLYVKPIDFFSVAGEMLLTSDQPGDVRNVRIERPTNGVMPIGMTIIGATDDYYEALLVDTDLMTTSERVRSPAINADFVAHDFRRVGDSYVWLLALDDLPYLLAYSPDGGWSEPVELYPGFADLNGSVGNLKLHELVEDAVLITWQHCRLGAYATNSAGVACDTYWSQYVPGEGVSEHELLAPGLETTPQLSATNVQVAPGSNGLVFGLSPDGLDIDWTWMDFE